MMLLAVAILAAASAPPTLAPSWRDPSHWPTPVMDTRPPPLPTLKPGAVLILSKTNGFRDNAQIAAANIAIRELAETGHRDAFVTENAAVMNKSDLKGFAVVVLNSVSGNIFTNAQRAAFRDWIERGGGVVLLHGAGGDPTYDWDWYRDALLGVHFVGHPPREDQFQQARIDIAAPAHPIMKGIPRAWLRTDEWYAFDHPPAGGDTHILATLDETTFQSPPIQRMGMLHPIIWTRCVSKGRAVFSALGHKAESYSEPLHRRLIANAIGWAGGKSCTSYSEQQSKWSDQASSLTPISTYSHPLR